MTEKSKPAQKFFTPLEQALNEDNERITARQQLLDRVQHDESVAGSDKSLATQHQHDYDPAAAAKKNFDQKIYLLPPSFNALRQELHENWRTLFYGYNDVFKTTAAWAMAFDAAAFIAMMNLALDMQEQLDTDNVDAICHAFLNALRNKRGLSSLQ
jgi:hypothetical protein